MSHRSFAPPLALALAILAWGGALGPAQALPGDIEAIAKASDLDHDPLDFQAVSTVCAKCHGAAQFLGSPRSSGRWEQTYEAMTGFGATGDEDQLNRVVRYFQLNLTIINVNTSPEGEIGPTLEISNATADALIARRQKRPFTDVADLATVPGVDPQKLKTLKSKGLLQF